MRTFKTRSRHSMGLKITLIRRRERGVIQLLSHPLIMFPLAFSTSGYHLSKVSYSMSLLFFSKVSGPFFYEYHLGLYLTIVHSANYVIASILVECFMGGKPEIFQTGEPQRNPEWLMSDTIRFQNLVDKYIIQNLLAFEI